MVASSKPDVLEYRPSKLLSDEPPLETYRHLNQIMLLLWCLNWWWRDRPDAPPSRRNNFFAAVNLTIYYSPRNERFRGPDFFVVLDTEYRERTSWVVWEADDKYPNVIIEMLSDSTAETDRVTKREIYQNVFRTPEYFGFDPYSLEFQGLRLSQQGEYVEIPRNDRGWMWSEQLELYLGIVEEKLRFLTATRELVPDPTESSIQEMLRAEAAEAKYERLRSQLQERGIDPDEFN
ncbi:MAG: Uma2 family endonuclease [Hormoscilla sp. GM102CHS1]|nr:Uma2 family endonuclease [Hormoscilla sp. GM102CHS1]